MCFRGASRSSFLDGGAGQGPAARESRHPDQAWKSSESIGASAPCIGSGYASLFDPGIRDDGDTIRRSALSAHRRRTGQPASGGIGPTAFREGAIGIDHRGCRYSGRGAYQDMRTTFLVPLGFRKDRTPIASRCTSLTNTEDFSVALRSGSTGVQMGRRGE